MIHISQSLYLFTKRIHNINALLCWQVKACAILIMSIMESDAMVSCYTRDSVILDLGLIAYTDTKP